MLLLAAGAARRAARQFPVRIPEVSPFRAAEERALEEPQVGRNVWQGRIGDVSLRVDMLPSGRIASTWNSRGNERRAVVDTIQQLEQRVLFQLMLGAGPDSDKQAQEIIAAVKEGQEGLPDPTKAAPPQRTRRRPGGPPRHRRSRRRR